MNQPPKQRHSRWSRPKPIIRWDEELPEGVRVLSAVQVLRLPNGMPVDVYGFNAKHEIRRHSGRVVQWGPRKVFRWWDTSAGKYRTEQIEEYSARVWAWPVEETQEAMQ